MGHPHHVVAPEKVGCAIVIVSDTRGKHDDASGPAIRMALEMAGHPVRTYTIVPDEAAAIRTALTEAVGRTDTLVIVMSGGTGIAPRDITIESLADLWEKELPGFGELFRSLSYAEIGTKAFLSRAMAGVVGGKFVVVLPGSPAACRLAMERVVLPELGHVAGLLAKRA